MIPIERLAAAALGDLDVEAEAEVETHVLACDACAARYTELLRLGRAIGAFVREGGLTMPVSSSLLARADAEGIVSRRYRLDPNQTVPCTAGATDVYALTEFHADLEGVTRVDLVEGPRRHLDVPFEAGKVMTLTSSALLRTLPSMQIPFTLLAVGPDGERVVAEYVLSHSAFRG